MAVADNTLALDQFVSRCERVRIAWGLFHDPTLLTPEFRYEMRVHDGPARGMYRGETATHAASKAIAAFDELKIGWAAE